MRLDKETLQKVFETARNRLEQEQPLIHCITNPISINDCANAVLAIGGKPIMAEHPKEVEKITQMAQALAVNLGNITDARMESILLSGHIAKESNIPLIIDAVGVTCSEIRYELAKKFISECMPAVIKGNVSEMKALYGAQTQAAGIDVDIHDRFHLNEAEKMQQVAGIVKEYAAQTGAVVIASGEVDLISDGTQVVSIANGCARMSRLTGTGCMLNVLTATFLSVCNSFEAAVLATVLLGIAGEIADDATGMGSFHVALLDALSTIHSEVFADRARIMI